MIFNYLSSPTVNTTSLRIKHIVYRFIALYLFFRVSYLVDGYLIEPVIFYIMVFGRSMGMTLFPCFVDIGIGIGNM